MDHEYCFVDAEANTETCNIKICEKLNCTFTPEN